MTSRIWSALAGFVATIDIAAISLHFVGPLVVLCGKSVTGNVVLCMALEYATGIAVLSNPALLGLTLVNVVALGAGFVYTFTGRPRNN